jgi:hypothetical protein
MESLVRAALVGTARQGASPPPGTAHTDDLVARLGDLDAERSLLLRAGALAAYRLAGHAPGGAVDPMEAAPAETARSCSPAAADLIGRMLDGTHVEFLPEALTRLGHAGLVLPPELLIAALNMRLIVIGGARVALAHALGARGRWLAEQNPAWGWVREVLDERDPPPADADALWEEGEPRFRQSMFHHMRRADPTHARDWLAATWAREKANLRADLIGLLDVGLSAADEPLLTQALADKSGDVRQAAARLLARLPDSAFAVRMRERADALLTCSNGALRAKPPATFDPAWARDDITEQAPGGTGKRAWWLMQLLVYVPPAYWLDRLGASPEQLAAAAGKTDYEAALIEGWSRAALLHQDAAWAPALWEWWLAPQRKGTLTRDDADEVRNPLGALVSRALAEERIGRLLGTTNERAHPDMDSLVAALSAPWSAAFGEPYLEAARMAAAGTDGKQGDANDWNAGMNAAVTALPPDCFAAALEPWTVHEPEQQSGARWQQQIEEFTEALDFRRQLVEAIPLDE